MRVGVLGTGMVGRAIATKLVELGHDALMGSRSAGNESATEWVAAAGPRASQGTFADAAAHGELLFNCTAGAASLEAIGAARGDDLAGKVLVDVSNPLDFSRGAPRRFTSSSNSLAELIQDAFPEARVVKSLNTVNCEVMVDPGKVPGEHDVFVCGNDDAAKAAVVELLRGFGWPADHVLDLGDLTAARATEAYLLLWIRLSGALQTRHLNVRVMR